MIHVGQRLREAREACSMSLEEVARRTRIPRAALEAMEAGDTSQLPAPVFVRGFVRSYGTLVGLEANELLRSLQLDEAPTSTRSDDFASVVRGADPSPSRNRPVSLPPYAPLFGEVEPSTGPAIHFSHAALIVLAAGMLLAAWLMAGLDSDEELEAAGPGTPAIHQQVDGVSGYTRADAGL